MANPNNKDDDGSWGGKIVRVSPRVLASRQNEGYEFNRSV